MKFIKPNLKNLYFDKINEDGSFAYFNNFFVIRWVFKERLRQALNLVDENDLSTKEEILDLGTGCGYLLPSLSKLGEVYASDNKSVHLEKARELCNHNNVKCNFVTVDLNKKLPFENESFGIVMCISVLEHLKNVEHAISEIKRVLKDDGTLIVGVPVERFLVNFLFKSLEILKSLKEKKTPNLFTWKNNYQDFHFSDFSLIENKLNAHFNIIETKNIPPLPLPDNLLLYKLYKCKKRI